MSKKIRILLILTIVTAFSCKILTRATTINEQRIEKKRLEGERNKTKNKISKLKEKKGKIEKAIRELDEKKQKIELGISEYRKKIKRAEAVIDRIKLEIEIAEKLKKEQYYTMKKRIKYLYENGDSDYFSIMLGVSDADTLNGSEYAMKISEYDNNLLEKYEATRRYESDKKREKEDKVAKLNVTLGELKVKREENKRLAKAKEVQIGNFNQLIKEAGQKVSEYDLAIEKREKYINDLIARAEKQRKERLARIAELKRLALLSAKKGEISKAVTGKVSNLGMIWPMPSSRYITSGFGYRNEVMPGSGSFHNGIDIAVNAGTPIIAAKAGVVIDASYHWSMGNHVIIDHGGGVYTVYMHASKLLVSVGSSVNQGDTIALVGTTGMSTGPHLHFSVKVNGHYVNPLNYVSP